VRRLSSIFLPAAALMMFSGCTNRPLEPARTIPETWITWDTAYFSFRHPPDISVTIRSRDAEGVRVVLNSSPSGKVLLNLRAGHNLPFPGLKQDGKLPQSYTRIGAFKADRLGPMQLEWGYTGECLMELGGKQTATQVHAYYARLDPLEQDLAETIIASIRPR